MTAFKEFIVLTLLATGSCSSLPQADEGYESRPQADEGYKVCKNPLKWSTPGCKKLFETMKKEDPTEKNSGRIINGEDVPLGEYPWFAKPLVNEYWAGWYGKFPYIQRLLNPSQSILIITFTLTIFIGLILCSTRLWSYVSFS